MDLNRINQLIDESGITKEVIAQKLGISRYTLYKKLNGETEFTASELVALADILRLTIEERQSIFVPLKLINTQL